MTGNSPTVNRFVHAVVCGILICCIAPLAAGLSGCKKAAETHPAAVPTTAVEIAAADIKPDGSITPAGLAKVQAKSDASHLTVAFLRAPVGDAALTQLAQFPNVKRIEAYGSKITAAGVEKLKQTSPAISVGY